MTAEEQLAQLRQERDEIKRELAHLREEKANIAKLLKLTSEMLES